MKFFRLILIAVALLMAIPSITSCKDDDKDEPGGSIVGTWKATFDNEYEIYTFNSDGTYKYIGYYEGFLDEEYLQYSISGNIITFIDEDYGNESYPFSIDGNKLIINYDDEIVIYYRQ